MSKIPYNQLALEVDKLYSKSFEPADNQKIIDHCEFIRNFIEACGWSIDDYLAHMWRGECN